MAHICGICTGLHYGHRVELAGHDGPPRHTGEMGDDGRAPHLYVLGNLHYPPPGPRHPPRRKGNVNLQAAPVLRIVGVILYQQPLYRL